MSYPIYRLIYGLANKRRIMSYPIYRLAKTSRIMSYPIYRLANNRRRNICDILEVGAESTENHIQ